MYRKFNYKIHFTTVNTMLVLRIQMFCQAFPFRKAIVILENTSYTFYHRTSVIRTKGRIAVLDLNCSVNQSA